MSKKVIPYFGKYVCECGVRSATDLHFEVHNLKHIVDDISQILEKLLPECKNESIILLEVIKCHQHNLALTKQQIQAILFRMNH